MQKILLVDDDPLLLSSMRDLIEALLPVKCILVESFEQLVAQRKNILAPGVSFALIDINLGHDRPDGVAVLQWLQQHQFSGKSYFLTGHAKEHPSVKEACEKTGTEVFEKPIEVDQLFSLIQGSLHAGSKAS